MIERNKRVDWGWLFFRGAELAAIYHPVKGTSKSAVNFPISSTRTRV